ncbi:MAG: hypothetical protein KTQ13_13610, partial [Ferruginibacter sp.]|nr:hypothetical protein [Ferruginibacter sp.]
MENNTSDQRTERILKSLDGLQRSSAPDFFYTRLLGKMQNEPEKKQALVLRPVFITAVTVWASALGASSAPVARLPLSTSGRNERSEKSVEA